MSVTNRIRVGVQVNLLALTSLLSCTVEAETPACESGTISSIEVDNNNVFDLTNPKEDKLFYRATNTLHLVTRKKVIRSQLLFRVGDCYSKRIAEEGERILRENRYIQKATINAKKIAKGMSMLL